MNFASILSFLKDNANSTQFALFASVLISLWLLERLATAQPAREKLKHTSINILYMLSALPIQLSMMLLLVSLANWAGEHQWGLIRLLPNAENPWIKFGLMFLVLDFLDYVYHFTAHHFAPLWKLHLLHHTDERVDVSTTFREHPGETMVRTCFLTFCVFACGASVEVLMLRQTFETFANVTQHTTFRLPNASARIVGWLFVTPNLHHTHHHFQRPGTDCNYGDVLSIWDRLFGTYVDLSREDTVFGLDTHPGEKADRTLRRLLAMASSSRAFAHADRLYRAARPLRARRRMTATASVRPDPRPQFGPACDLRRS